MDMDIYGDDMDSKSNAKCLKKLPFTSTERELIIELVSERPIIEDKRTHVKNIELKREAWQELADVFNSQPFVSQRSALQLKRCWENIKSIRKKELSQKRNIISSHDTPSEGDTKIEPEVVQPRKKCSLINSQTQHDQVLHDLRCTREMIVIEREKNLLEFEKESHRLQIEKLKLEIDILTKKNS